MAQDKKRTPGDIILDRYLAAADEATREAARAQWMRFVQAILAVAVRLAEDERQAGDSPNPPGRPTIRSLP